MDTKNILKHPEKHIKTEEINFCNYCFIKSKKVIPCAKCHTNLCKGCTTFINDVPFCNECIIDIVKNKTKLLIMKGDIKEYIEEK